MYDIYFTTKSYSRLGDCDPIEDRDPKKSDRDPKKSDRDPKGRSRLRWIEFKFSI